MGNVLGAGYTVENLDVRNVMERDERSCMVHKGHPAVKLWMQMDGVLTGDGDADAVDGLYYVMKKEDLKNLNGMLRRAPDPVEPEPDEAQYKDIWAEMRGDCRKMRGINYKWGTSRIAVGLEKDEEGPGSDGKLRKPNPGEPVPEFVRPAPPPRSYRGRY